MADQDQAASQQRPSNGNGLFNQQTFLVQEYLANNVGTTKPAVVKAVGDGTVDVQIMVNQVDGDGTATEHGKVFGVKYVTLQMGTGAVKMKPAVGDIGLLLCCDRDISSVVSTKAVAPPGSGRKFSASDGVYLGGFLNKDPEQWVEFKDDGLQLHDKTGNELTSSPTGWSFKGVVTFQNNVQLAGQILGGDGDEYTGDIKTTGDVQAGDVSLKSHKHKYDRPTTGGTTPTDTSAPD